mmetsp:Transcript_86213/g.279072  ORF Transcript_86213/g.279072 Transcript_86213/m.279072 type:complete len:280 (+) Transcript_86213:266-1105(+)
MRMRSWSNTTSRSSKKGTPRITVRLLKSSAGKTRGRHFEGSFSETSTYCWGITSCTWLSASTKRRLGSAEMAPGEQSSGTSCAPNWPKAGAGSVMPGQPLSSTARQPALPHIPSLESSRETSAKGTAHSPCRTSTGSHTPGDEPSAAPVSVATALAFPFAVLPPSAPRLPKTTLELPCDLMERTKAATGSAACCAKARSTLKLPDAACPGGPSPRIASNSKFLKTSDSQAATTKPAWPQAPPKQTRPSKPLPVSRALAYERLTSEESWLMKRPVSSSSG